MPDKVTYEQLKSEIEKIAEFLAQAKREIVAFVPPGQEDAGNKKLIDAADELNEVVRHTEEATNTIMDNADAIIKASTSVGDEALAATFNQHALGILEACSFQDITGQRIKKVLKTLEHVEYRIANLIKLFGGTLPEGYQVSEIAPEPLRRPDEDLLNGPQLGKDAPTQDDIDKLFSSL
jgi:chemotaxis protein CheZ